VGAHHEPKEIDMLNEDGSRCWTCGSKAPEWIAADDYDGPEDYEAAYLSWEAHHTDCQDDR
jgi:hypothetical protein